MNNMKLYATRVMRYLIKMVLLMAIVFGVMAATGTLNLQDRNFFQLLFSTWNGLILIGLLLALALSYPKMSFTTVKVRASLDRDRQLIRDAFAVYGYKESVDEPGRMVFRVESATRRALMQFDDAVTLTQTGDLIEMEGLKKIVSRVDLRITSALERQ